MFGCLPQNASVSRNERLQLWGAGMMPGFLFPMPIPVPESPPPETGDIPTGTPGEASDTAPGEQMSTFLLLLQAGLSFPLPSMLNKAGIHRDMTVCADRVGVLGLQSRSLSPTGFRLAT